jgi:hypothetical protein
MIQVMKMTMIVMRMLTVVVPRWRCCDIDDNDDDDDRDGGC